MFRNIFRAKKELRIKFGNNSHWIKPVFPKAQESKSFLNGGKSLLVVSIAKTVIIIVVLSVGGYYFFTKNNNFQLAFSLDSFLSAVMPIMDKNSDTDSDGLPDEIEKFFGTNIANFDSDGDTFSDLDEIKSGYSPLIAGMAGKYPQNELQDLKNKIKIANQEFYENNFAEEDRLKSKMLSSQASVSFVCGKDTIKDADNNIYNTVKIGEQCWMKENLKVTKNLTGRSISRYCYNNDSMSCDLGGGLYDWGTIMSGFASCNGIGELRPQCLPVVTGICPVDWHIPSYYEWTLLEKNAGSSPEAFSYSTDITIGWSGTDEGTNLKLGGSSGFDGILVGYRNSNGTYDFRNDYAIFWSSTKVGTNARGLFLALDKPTVNSGVFDRENAYSVRCLKD